MSSRSPGATSVFTRPDAQVAATSAETPAGVSRRERPAGGEREAPRLRPRLRLRFADGHVRTAGGAGRALAPGVVGEVAGPARTRRGIAGALAAAPAAPAARGDHGNVPL